MWAAARDPSQPVQDDSWLKENDADFSATKEVETEHAVSFSCTGVWPEEVVERAKAKGMPDETLQDNEDYFASRLTMSSASGITMNRLRWSWFVCGRPVVAPSDRIFSGESLSPPMLAPATGFCTHVRGEPVAPHQRHEVRRNLLALF